jgi:hypothetical protein
MKKKGSRAARSEAGRFFRLSASGPWKRRGAAAVREFLTKGARLGDLGCG